MMSTQQRFHSHCGACIRLSDNNTIASRIEGVDNGVVFTEYPVVLGTVFQVKILEYDTELWMKGSGCVVSDKRINYFMHYSLKSCPALLLLQSIGLTTQLPDNIKIRTRAIGWSNRSDYWILDRNSAYHKGKAKEMKITLDTIREGQTVGCMVSKKGELHVYIDGLDNGIVWTGLPTRKPFRGVVDVCWGVTEVCWGVDESHYWSAKRIQLVPLAAGEYFELVFLHYITHDL